MFVALKKAHNCSLKPTVGVVFIAIEILKSQLYSAFALQIQKRADLSEFVPAKKTFQCRTYESL